MGKTGVWVLLLVLAQVVVTVLTRRVLVLFRAIPFYPTFVEKKKG